MKSNMRTPEAREKLEEFMCDDNSVFLEGGGVFAHGRAARRVFTYFDQNSCMPIAKSGNTSHCSEEVDDELKVQLPCQCGFGCMRPLS